MLHEKDNEVGDSGARKRERWGQKERRGHPCILLPGPPFIVVSGMAALLRT